MKKTKKTKNEKFMLTNDTKEIDGVTLHRVQATSDFGDVQSGDLGGWLEEERNLSPCGKAWVADNAAVYGRARVLGNARVEGDATVCDRAKVSASVKISGKTRVYENAQIYGNVEISGAAKVPEHWHGCFGVHPVATEAYLKTSDSESPYLEKMGWSKAQGGNDHVTRWVKGLVDTDSQSLRQPDQDSHNQPRTTK